MVFVFSALTGYSQREVLSLDGEWEFVADKSNQAEARNWAIQGLPADMVRTLTVPHTWNVDTGLEEYMGKGWYEKSVTVPLSWKDKRIRIFFDAVYHDAFVYLNGKKIAEHIGAGYTRFIVDVTKEIRFDRANRLVVCADNSFSRNNIPFLNVFDWAADGGITRSVYLVASGDPTIEYVHVKAVPDVSNPDSIHKGEVSFDVKLSSASSIPEAEIELKITEENQPTQNVVWTKKMTLKDLVNQEEPIFFQLNGIKPWRFDHPNLYKLDVIVKVSGKTLDNYSATFGFRDVRTKGHRIFLNGEPIRLMGVEWMPGSSTENGMAETHEELETMLRRLKSVNCIYTRFHWQQDDFIFDWCDRNGILVQEELPYWGWETVVKDTLLELGKIHVLEMIRDHYNHPSIICWGIGNELDGHNPVNIKGLSELTEFVRELDDSRFINYVSNSLAINYKSAKIPADASSIGSLLNYNDYQEQWYQSDPVLLPGVLDTIHVMYPGKPLIIAEYGLCEPANRGGDSRRIKDLLFHQAIYDTKPFVAGAIYFSLNDYRTHMGEAGDSKFTQRVHGVFDIFGNRRKSAEYLTLLSSPIEPVGFWPQDDKITIGLLGSLGLPSYSMKGYSYVFANSNTDYKQLERSYFPDLEPGKRIDLIVENKYYGTGRLVIFNHAGFEVFNYNY
ncbi:MAG TPA: glycoside hydrolase family 2 TIM barrel-domain containing protein [Bacteroidales bacterium]|nr:glycoside hydrolase family 2 TIM barrel-domain containing protein [Bacteroidales bacterium]